MNHLLEQIIRQSPHLSWMVDRTIYITLHGSRAFGTNVESSDDDYKGICIPPFKYYFGFQHNFEQAECKKPDAVIYELSKYCNLAAAGNPSIIETLFTDSSDHLFVSPLGEKLIENRDKFLSKRVRFSFSGYAVSQLNRIKLHRRYFLDSPKAPPTRKEFGLPEHTLLPADQLMAAEAEVQKELDQYKFDFIGELNEPMKIAVRSIMTKMLAELKVGLEGQWLVSAKKVGLDDNLIRVMQLERNYKNRHNEWTNYQSWLKTRNPARAADERKFGVDLKHAYHLVRLMRMCREILTTGKVIVKRPDREELLAIRNGAWSYEQLVEFAEREDKEMQAIYETYNVLPKVPDIKALDELCVSLIQAMG